MGPGSNKQGRGNLALGGYFKMKGTHMFSTEMTKHVTTSDLKLRVIELLIPCSSHGSGYTNEAFKLLLERAEQVYQWVKVEDKNEKPYAQRNNNQ